jgi:four helix bundle protein
MDDENVPEYTLADEEDLGARTIEEFAPVDDFTQLRVWQAAMDLTEHIYTLTRSLPKDESFGLISQLRRASVSVPSNIAEGSARGHLREYIRFVTIARSSLAEIRTQVLLCERLGYISREHAIDNVERVLSVSRQLTSLRNALVRKLESI